MYKQKCILFYNITSVRECPAPPPPIYNIHPWLDMNHPCIDLFWNDPPATDLNMLFFQVFLLHGFSVVKSFFINSFINYIIHHVPPSLLTTRFHPVQYPILRASAPLFFFSFFILYFLHFPFFSILIQAGKKVITIYNHAIWNYNTITIQCNHAVIM